MAKASLEFIQKIHERTLEIAWSWHKDLEGSGQYNRFGLRARGKKRLNQGFWFLGNEDYLFFAPYNKGDTHNKTRTIGFVARLNGDRISLIHHELAFSGQGNPEHAEFYQRIGEVLGMDVPEGTCNQQLKLTGTDWEAELKNYLYKAVPKMNAVIEEMGLEKMMFVPESKFVELYQQTEAIKERGLMGPEGGQSDDEDEGGGDDDGGDDTSCDSIPRNLILYGPPGTGKTYHTTNHAVAICTDERWEEIEKLDRKKLSGKFQTLQDAGQVDFVTFHQSMTYEDFVEGIKPVLSGGGSLEYEIRSGIFTQICERARNNWMQRGKPGKKRFETAWQLFAEPLVSGEKKEIKVKTTKGAFHVFEITDGGTIRFRKQNGSTLHTLSLRTLGRVYANPDAIDQMGGLQTYYRGMVEALHETPVQLDSESTAKQFVLVIDEINRGNVASIMGELITLLEPDKRLGADNALEVRLPYSQEPFGVPPNLHIIATMNTADRSVEALDTALRRRFEFKEMMPLTTPDVIQPSEVEGVDLCRLLETINARIECLLDRDHLIGHSYLIGLKSLQDLKKAFANKILPLLQEYFYHDPGRIGMVLGSDFVVRKSKGSGSNGTNLRGKPRVPCR